MAKKAAKKVDEVELELESMADVLEEPKNELKPSVKDVKLAMLDLRAEWEFAKKQDFALHGQPLFEMAMEKLEGKIKEL